MLLQFFSTGLKWIGGVGVIFVGGSTAVAIAYGSPEIALAHLRGDSLLLAPNLDLGAVEPGEMLALQRG